MKRALVQSGSMGVFDPIVRTFGPFLIPAVLFGAGVCLYALLWWLGDGESKR